MVAIQHVSELIFLQEGTNGMLTTNIQGKKLKNPIKVFKDNEGRVYKGWDERYYPFYNINAKPLKKSLKTPMKIRNLKLRPYIKIKEYGIKPKIYNLTETKELAREYYRDAKDEELSTHGFVSKDFNEIYRAITFLEINGVMVKTNLEKFTYHSDKKAWILR